MDTICKSTRQLHYLEHVRHKLCAEWTSVKDGVFAVGRLLGATIWIVACSFITQHTGYESVSVKAAQDTAWLSSRSGGSFEIPIIVHNASRENLYTQWCGVKAERLIEGTWEKVYAQDCLDVDNSTTVAPGQSATVTFFVVGAINTIARPHVALRLTPGAYRVVIPLWREDRDRNQVGLRETQCRSTTFTVAIKPAE
jgi:hypothetical protein